MAAVFRHWSRQGYVFGISGHISVRDPEYTDAFWTNPLGVHFGLLRASDMILLSLDGSQLHPPVNKAPVLQSLTSHTTSTRALTRPANAAGFLIHAAIHRRRPDVHAACHAHTPHGRAYSALGRPLEMLTQDICKLYNRHAVYTEYGGVVLDDTAAEGEAIATALGDRNVAVILQNHGLLTVGQTVDEAAWLFDVTEAGCRDHLMLDATGHEKKIIGSREAEFNLAMEGTPEVCYAEFQAYYDYEEAMSNGDFKN
ncbi:hypothetical protein BT93_L5157 [Corymbia citriodora subsp. variegata]|uniref:Class II aldolase/adducin N-terminal domain-containing protein n=1 Tax=Corymbia citriodora subsp. variegata TaxID=360336 RepID=A0A8T0CK31_CORYI|nr:hypothetical protein BT93_L5157 [Corymbia citriodora subsp. variegata]